MVRFYVYLSAKNELEFIETNSMERFAAYEFDPALHTFSGIAVDADDIDKASKSYQHPTSTVGEYIMVNEPQATVARRQIADSKFGLQQSFDRVKEKLEYLRACIKMQVATMKMHEANKLLNEASQELFETHGRPGAIPPNMIFDRLSDAAIKAAFKYHGDKKKPG